MEKPHARDEHDSESMSDLEKSSDWNQRDEEEVRSSSNPLPDLQFDGENEPRGTTNDQEAKLEQQNQSDAAVQAALDWEGPDDPANPHNWPMSKRIYHAVPPAFFGLAVTFGTSIYTPAVADIMIQFHVSRTAAIVGLTVYVLGLAFGPILSAPLSETYGRKIVYLVTLPIFMLFTLGAGFSQNFASLIVCRFFAGFFGSPCLAVGSGTNADLWPPKIRALSTSSFVVAPFLGPSLGPFIGGFVAQYKGWRWSQWCMLFLALFVYIIALPTEETYKKIILKRRAKKRGIAPPQKLKTSGAAAIKSALFVSGLRPMYMLFTEPIVFFLSLYTAFVFGILFLLFAAFPFVFEQAPYNFTVSQVGLAFLAIGLGVCLGMATGIVSDRKIYLKQHTKAVQNGRQHAAPEHRLYSAMIGSFGIPIGLFWFAWTADKGVHWAVPVVATIPFAWGNFCVFIASALYMVDVYGPLYGSSAIAANGIFRYTLGAVFPLFTFQMYSKLGIGWATSLLGFLSVLMIPIPWILFKWGPQVRAKTQYPVMMA